MLDGMALGRSRDSGAVRITTAGVNRNEEIDGRVRNYLVSMTFRVICFGAAVAVGPGPLRWVLIVGAVFLPYVAVVMANATDTRKDPHTIDRVVVNPELESPGRPSALGETPTSPEDEESP